MSNELQRRAPDTDRTASPAIVPRSHEDPARAQLTWTDTPGARMPDYLLRYYGWAYVSRLGVWLFDHQPIINAILFGHYRPIMNTVLRLLDPEHAGTTLQIAGVYGKLTPTLAGRIRDLHMIDIAPVQLDLAARKLAAAGRRARLARMNAEALTYRAESFDTTLMFLLLHEMPPEARQRSLAEAVRVTRPGGRLVIAEYGEMTRSHPLHRIAPLRWVLSRAEPFLGSFWRESLTARVEACGRDLGRRIVLDEQVLLFGGFYRVLRFRIE